MRKQECRTKAESPLRKDECLRWSELDGDHVLRYAHVRAWLGGISARTLAELISRGKLRTQPVSDGRKGIAVRSVREYLSSMSSDRGADQAAAIIRRRLRNRDSKQT